ncbi:MAG TPA: FtsQ-type POTRA domain-containing protein [Candidatus Baltobacteraceae bacterium]|jgi:cell division protein FtsQ
MTTVRRRAKPSLLARLRVFWIFIVLLLIAAGVAGFRIATWPGFTPKNVDVYGTKHVAVADVLKRAAIPSNRNAWLIDKHAAETRVDAIPWVQSTRIHRSLPASVRIVVVERTPAACVQSASARYLVDANGHVIETSCNDGPRAVVIGWPGLTPQQAGSTIDVAQLTRFLSDVRTLRANHVDPVYSAFDRFGGLDVTLSGGIAVRFGDDRDLAQKATLVDPILQTYGKRSRDVAVIDLRAPSTPVVEERSHHK